MSIASGRKSARSVKRDAEMKERKIPKRIQRVLDACNEGQTLCMSLANTQVGTTLECWFLHPSNRKVAKLAGREASLMLRPSCDGLFGSDTSQTWRS